MSLARTFRNTCVGAVLALAGTAAMAGDGSAASTASEQVSIGTLSIIGAPLVSVVGSAHGQDGLGQGSAVVVAGGTYVVSGVAQLASGTVELILSSAGSAARLSVKLRGKAVDAIGMSVGTTVQVVSETTGTLLVASGKVLAFIPNALGEALLSQQRLPAQ
jgi:hypothetical protein